MTAIHRGMDQRKLDAQYDQRTLVPQAADYIARWAARSSATIAAHGLRRIRYGPEASETMLVFGETGNEGSGAHLHLHGGAWRQLSAETTAFVAEGLISTGLPVALANFALAPAASLHTIVGQVRRAFVRLHRRYGPVTVSAHSSGCHLAAMLLDPVWQRDAGLTHPVRGMVLASGVYDLWPVRLSARNAYLNLSDSDVEALSPHRHLPAGPPPVTLLWGDGELDEFQRQSREFAAALAAAGGAVETRVLAHKNHFDVYDLFADPQSPVCQAVRTQARLPLGQ